MTILIGEKNLTSIYHGDSHILKIYKGETLVWNWYCWVQDAIFQPEEAEGTVDLGDTIRIDRLWGIRYTEIDE